MDLSKNHNLLLYSFNEESKQTDEVSKILNEVKKKIGKPDLELIEKMKEDKEFFSSKKFVTSTKALERLSQLINAIRYKIPIIEEGPTGTSKTFTTLIAIDYLNYRKQKENPEDKSSIKELLRFNLSSQTKSDDLLCQIAGDPDSPAGLKTIDGVFLRAFRDGYPLLLDEINLANESVLQFLLEAISSGVLSIIINGKGLQEINMHEDFCLIATQNPPTGMFAGKRNNFSIDFLAKFSKVKFEIDLEELKEITKGSAKEFNYNNEKVIDEMVKFHEKWVSNYVKDDDVQCFTIRDILATIKLISENKGIFESINSIYGARYPKQMKLKLQEVLNEFPLLSQRLEGFKQILDENFPFCYDNETLIKTVNQCIFSLENGRNIIISGNEGCGKSFLSKMISKYYDSKHFEKNQLNNITNYCICTNKLECSDLLGNQKPSDKIQEGEEMLVWKNGFLTDGIKNGFTVVLDNINEAPSTVTERLNGLLDKTYDNKEAFFELPENPNENKIKINPNFRIICVCEYEKIKKMSPAFINRFDVIVLDDIFDKNISDEELKKFIGITLILKENSLPEEIEEEIQISEHEDFGQELSDDSFSNMSGEEIEEKKEEERKSIDSKNSQKKSNKSEENDVQSKGESKEIESNNYFDGESKASFGISSTKLAKVEITLSEKEKNLELKKSVDSFLKNTENHKFLEESIKTIRKIENFTIYNITKLINSTYILYKIINRENKQIDIDLIINFVYDLIFNPEKHIEKLNINEKILDFFIEKLDEKDGNDENDDKYHFKDSESLRKFMVFVMASSYINLHLCIIGPPGGGKTTSARAFARIRGKVLEQNEEPFRMYTFNEGTKPHDFYGSSTLYRGKIKFNYGALSQAIKDGSVFIADEFNLTSTQTMRSILPALEHNFDKRNRIPGVEGPIIFNSKFFFVICQNESMTLGRNLIPKEIENRLRTVFYPPAEINDIKQICKNINEDINDFLNVDKNNRMLEEEAKKCGEYMMKLNKLNQRIISPWSLRDIHKLFTRIASIQKEQSKFIGIGVVENILFYTMSSVTKANEERILDDIINLLVDIFYKENKEDKGKELKTLYLCNPKLEFKSNYIGDVKIITINLLKDKCKINLEKLMSSENKEKSQLLQEKKEKLEGLSKLPKFLNSLFKINLASQNEPILLSGNTSYKKELAKEFLENASFISLNQEITINQLLGSSSFLNKEDSKVFYLKELCNCLKINNLPIYMNYLKECLEKEKSENQEEYEAKKLELKEKIDKIKDEIANDKYPFKIPVDNLYNKLFDNKSQSGNENDNNLLSDMVIEFRPGLILSAILGQRSLILGDLPNAKTVVLERFNELFSGKHNLTLNEDIHDTFTTAKKKELSNFTDFRIIATCKKGYENRLSEALLSRFTILSIEDYSQEEQREVLNIKAKGKKLKNDDINKLINYSKEFQDKFNIEFPLTKMVKCLNLYEQFYKNNKNADLFFPFYILANGLLEKRNENNIQKLREIEPNFVVPITNILQVVEEKNILESQFTNLGIFSSKIRIPKNHDEIYFSEKMKEMLDTLHTGLCTKTPVILEGSSEQGKSTAIKYLADYLNLEIINVNISKETKVEDLLCQISIEKEENGSIKIKNNETKLLKALKSHEQIPKSIIVFQNINNASPAVLETLTSIFGPVNTNILLPNGDIVQKGEAYIFAIFNRQSGASREKLPSNLIHNSLYYIVENPDDNDIRNIINTLFEKNNLEDEITFFQKYYFEAKKFISQQNNEISLTISDIKKYILFRKKCPSINTFIIIQFIFIYRFYKFKIIEESKKKLGLMDLTFDPEIEYQNDAKHLKIKLIPGDKGSEINVETFNNDAINSDLENIINCFNNITIYGKYALIFLICSFLTKRACILQGENCSGKTFLIRFLAKMFGRKLIEYQMNSNVGMNIFTRDSIINENLSTKDKDNLGKLISKVKDSLGLDENEYGELNDLTVPQYKKIIQIINSKISNLKGKEDDSRDLLIQIKKQITLIISPVNQIQYRESDFIKALREGEWVLIDGIESAPNQIIEKIIALCGDNPELNIFETGKGIYFNKKGGENVEKINENFHLFITYNFSKDGAKKIDKSLFSKCMTFTSPQIDSKVEDAALVLFSRLKNYNKNNQNIILNLSSRLSTFHNFCVKESQKNPYDFAGRIPITPNYLLFVSNIFNNSKNEPYENKVYSSLENYWKTISNDFIKNKFQDYSLAKFLEEPFELKIKQTVMEKLSNILRIIKQIQEVIVNNEKKSSFELAKFVTEILNLKLNQTDIETVIKHLNDTLILVENKNSHSYFGKIKQTKILLKILNSINDAFSKGKIDQQYFNMSFTSEEVEKIKSIKKPIQTLKLIKELFMDKSLYNQNIRNFIFDKNFSQLLGLVQIFINSGDRYSFKNLIAFLHQNKELIGALNYIFPYNNKKSNGFCKKLIWVISLLHKKQINFIIKIDNHFKFIYDENQKDRLNPSIVIPKDDFYFGYDTKIKCEKLNYQIKIEKEKKLFQPSLETSNIFLQMIEHFAEVTTITKNEMKKVLEKLMKNDKNINIPNNIFMLNHLFNKEEKNSKVSKVWTLILNFSGDGKIIEYLNLYLLPIESELIKIMEEAYKNIDKVSIKKVIELTNDLATIYDENSILWQDALGKQITSSNDKNNYLEQIIIEIDNLEKLNNKINTNLTPYIGRLKEIKANLNKGNEHNETIEKIKNRINIIKEKLNLYLNNSKYREYHRILSKLKTKVINSYEDNEEYILKLESETDGLLKSIDLNLSKLEESRNLWPTIKINNYQDNSEVILFKNLIWYSKIKEILSEIKKEPNIGKKKSFIPKLEQYNEIKPIVDYLEFKLDDKSNISLNDYNFIECHLRNIFLLKLLKENTNEDVINLDYINFEKQINNLIPRINTNENLYKYICIIANDYSTLNTNFNIILPNFRPLDLIYLFMSKTNRGCKNDLLLKEFPEISIEKIEKLIEIEDSDYIHLIIKIVTILIQEKFMNDQIKIPQNYEGVMKYIEDNENDDFFRCLKIAIKIAKLLNEKNSKQKDYLSNDDLIEYSKNIKKGYNYFITNKDIASSYPSLLYYYCKYKNATKLLFNKIKDDKYCKDLLANKEEKKEKNNEINIPFWIICLRIMSSFHIINYDYEKIFDKDMLVSFIKEVLEKKVKQKEVIDSTWLNLVLEDVPKEISQLNIRIYYDFFNNLSNSIITNNKYLKNMLEDLIRNLHKEVINLSFNNNSNLPIYINFSDKNEFTQIKDLMIDPNDYILEKLKNELKIILKKEFSKLKEIGALKTPLNNFIKNFDKMSKDLSSQIKKENEKGKEEYEQRMKNKNEILLKNEVDEKKKNYNLYKENYNEIKKMIQKELDNNSASCQKLIFKLDNKKIKKLKELQKLIKEDNNIYKYSAASFSITQFNYEIKNNSINQKSKIILKAGTFKDTDLGLKEKLYFNNLDINDIEVIGLIDIIDSNKYKELILQKDFTISFKKIEFFDLLPLFADEILKQKIQKGGNILRIQNSNIPEVIFNNLSQKDYISKLEQYCNNLKKLNNIFTNTNNDFIDKDYNNYADKIKKLFGELNENNNASIDGVPSSSINNIIGEIQSEIEVIDVKMKEFEIKYQSNFKPKLLPLYKLINEGKVFDKSFKLKIPEKHEENQNFQFNIEGLKEIDLSIPFISFDQEKNNLEFSSTNLEKIIGPIYPNLCGEQIEIKILNSIKNRVIYTYIEDINTISPNDNNKIRESIKYNDKINVKVEPKIEEGEDLVIKLKIPELYSDDEEIHYYHFNLCLKLEQSSSVLNNLIIPCKINIKMVPLTLLLISDNYNLTPINNKQMKLNTNFVYEKELLVFRLKNYFGKKLEEFQVKIESLEENESKEPYLKNDANEGIIELIIPEYEENFNDNFSKIHSIITIAFTEQYKIEVEIKAFIIPSKVYTNIYDYTKKRFNISPIIYFSYLDVKDNDFNIPIYLKVESTFWGKSVRAKIDSDINKNDIELEPNGKIFDIKDNQVFNFNLRLKKGFITETGVYEINIKLNGINISFKKIITIIIKEGEKPSIYNIHQLSREFDIFCYDEKKEIIKETDFENLIDQKRKKFNKSIIYAFNYYYTLKTFFTYENHKKKRLNDGNYEIENYIKCLEEINDNYYYHINKDGKIVEGRIKSVPREDLSYYNYRTMPIIFTILKFEKINVLLDFFMKIEDNIFKNWKDDDNDELKKEKVEKLKQLKSGISYNFEDITTILDFSDFALLIIKNKNLFDDLGKHIYDVFTEEETKEYDKLKEKFKKNEKNKEYEVISFFYKFFKNNRARYYNNSFCYKEIEESILKDKVKNLSKSYYIYDDKKSKEINDNLNQIKEQFKKYKKEQISENKENIYIIYDKKKPELAKSEDIKLDLEKSTRLLEPNQENLNSEPPDFKCDLSFNMEFSNINDVIDYYNKCISDTNILPLHIIKLLYNSKLAPKEKKKLNKELEKRFVKMVFSFKDLEFDKEDKCLIFKVIKEFKESMNDMLLKFEKGKTNFRELIPNIKLNQKVLDKVYVIEQRPEFKLEIKKWKISNNRDNNIFSTNKIIGFQFVPKKENKLEKSDIENYIEEDEKGNDEKQNNKDEKKAKNKKEKEKKIINIDANNFGQIKMEPVERYVANEVPPKKDIIKEKIEEINEEENIKKEPKKIIKVLKLSSDDRKEINNLQKPLDMNLNVPESEIDEQIKRIIDQMKDLNINSDFKLEKEPKVKFDISEYIKERNNNDGNNLEKVIKISLPISTSIITEISKKNLKDYIPFKELEVNLLVDCSRYISNEGKYFNAILATGIAMALNALKIRYSIGLMADYQFKIELKTIDDEHNNNYLQMLLENIYCPRLMTHYASCLDYAIEKFKTKEKKNSDRVFIMISNGLDKELKLRQRWAETFFKNDRHSFLFLFTEPKFKEKEIITFLRNEIWEPFRNLKDLNYSSIVKVMNYEPKITQEFMNKLADNIYACLSRKIDDDEITTYIKNYNNIKPRFELEKLQLSDKYVEDIISFIDGQISNDYTKFREPYVKKMERQKDNIDIRIDDINIQIYSKYQNKIMENKFNPKIIEKIEFFTKKFKEKKENLDLSSLDLIFQPNLPTQYVLSSKGNIIDMDAFFKYYLNPTPNPVFYKELDGGYIKNYGITVVIDTSISCINLFTYEHYFDTIRILLSILSFAELPSFDLVVTGTQTPIVICSDISTSNALSEKSPIWGNLYASLSPIYNPDLASAIKVAYDLNNIRRNESTNYIFVITDGLFSIPDQKVLYEKVKICENKGINVFGIGVGISPNGLENIFTNVIFSQNPYNLINAISGFFGLINYQFKEMPHTESFIEIKDYRPTAELFKDIIEKPEFFKLREFLSKIKFVPESIPMYNEEDAIDLDISLAHKENVFLKPTYSENCLKGQKLLIVMLWSNEMDPEENEYVNEKYIKEPVKGANTCIKYLLDYYGVEIKIVKNYVDAIKELITEDENQKGKCKYFAAMVMNGPNLAILPHDEKIKNEAEESRYILQFLEVLKLFWKNGGGVLLFNENEPFFFQTNLFLKMLEFPNIKFEPFQLYGNHLGGKEMLANNEGDLSKPGTFSRKRNVIDSYERSIIGHGLVAINEGRTLCYIDYDEQKVKPFNIFSRDTEGGVNSLYYIGTEGRGDIIIDNSYTKFLTDMKNSCTAKLVQNMIAWIARIDYHYMIGNDPKLERPRLIDYVFDPTKKCDKDIFKTKKTKKDDVINMKTLFAIDYSGSIQNKANYHEYLRKNILSKYFNKKRGDAIYIWESNKKKITYDEMIQIIDKRKGTGGTNSSLIAEILSLEKNNGFKHLIIVTDGEVSSSEIRNSDNLMQKMGDSIKLEFVSTFIIYTGGNVDLSVGAPYCRNIANSTIYIDKNNKEYAQPSLFKEDLDEWNNLEKNPNYTQEMFLKNYSRIENAVKAKTLGASSESTLEVLYKFKKNIESKGNVKPEFIHKIDILIKLAKEGNMNLSLKIT